MSRLKAFTGISSSPRFHREYIFNELLIKGSDSSWKFQTETLKEDIKSVGIVKPGLENGEGFLSQTFLTFLDHQKSIARKEKEIFHTSIPERQKHSDCDLAGESEASSYGNGDF